MDNEHLEEIVKRYKQTAIAQALVNRGYWLGMRDASFVALALSLIVYFVV